MLEFLQSYGLWILFGGAFLFMMTRGGGCGMGGTQKEGHDQRGRVAGHRSSAGQARLDDAAGQPIADDLNRGDVKTPIAEHSGCCH